MDILYIIGKGCSDCENRELRYSLCSIEKYGKNVGKVYVVGYCPDWLSDEVIKIPFEQPWQKKKDSEIDTMDNLAKKHANLTASVLYAVDNSDIGDEFLVSMDDHIYIRNVDFDNYPFYCTNTNGNLNLPKDSNRQWQKLLAATRKMLEQENLSIYRCVLHRNMHLSRKSIEECRTKLEDIVKNPIPFEPFAYLINYRYTKDKDFEFTSTNDLKISRVGEWYKVNPETTEVFSTYNFKKGSALDLLIKLLFKHKSKYEK